MQNLDFRGKILTVEGGWLVCPVCSRNRRLLRILPQTKAQDLPLYCKRCGNEILVNIDDKSLSRKSPSR